MMILQSFLKLAKNYNKRLSEEDTKTRKEIVVSNVSVFDIIIVISIVCVCLSICE